MNPASGVSSRWRLAIIRKSEMHLFQKKKSSSNLIKSNELWPRVRESQIKIIKLHFTTYKSVVNKFFMDVMIRNLR